MATFYKVLTDDLCSPTMGGDPIFEGTPPFVLPVVEVDQSPVECGPGWHACKTPEQALVHGGLWRNGRPSRLFKVEVPEDVQVIERIGKVRFATGTLAEEILDWTDILASMYAPFKSTVRDGLIVEIQKWREALSSPEWNPEAAKAGLREALDIRGLSAWRIKEFESEKDLRNAWLAKLNRESSTCMAWEMDLAYDAWNAWEKAGNRARDNTWEQARGAWAVWGLGAWDAQSALAVWVAASMGWTPKQKDPYLLTTGIRDARRNGLRGALPIGNSKTLGFVLS